MVRQRTGRRDSITTSGPSSQPACPPATMSPPVRGTCSRPWTRTRSNTWLTRGRAGFLSVSFSRGRQRGGSASTGRTRAPTDGDSADRSYDGPGSPAGKRLQAPLDHEVYDLVHRQFRGVDDQRIGGLDQRTRLPGAVESIARLQGLLGAGDVSIRRPAGPLPSCVGAPTRPLPGLAVRNTLTVASGATTVPMSRPSTTIPPAVRAGGDELALPGHHSHPHLRDRRHRAHRRGHRLPADRTGDVDPVHRDGRLAGVGAELDSSIGGSCGSSLSIPGVVALAQHPPGNCAVHRTGVEVAQAAAAARLRAPQCSCPTPRGRRPRRPAGARSPTRTSG